MTNEHDSGTTANPGEEPGDEEFAREKRATEVPDEAREDVAERPGSTAVDPDHADEVADEWGEGSFPASDPPSHY
ncbi:hypothetical protein D3248_04835 [Leucobacter zeae]|nr:hypothetical protein [Leucobacter zeae]